MTTTRYFIDAYNIQHASARLRKEAAHDLERARDILLEQVQSFAMNGDCEVTVVFDGRQQQDYSPAQSQGKGSMTFLFSPPQTTADSVIERLIYQASDRIHCIVVSNDRSLRSQCRGMGALVMESDYFLESIVRIEKSALEKIQKKKPYRANLIQDQLSSSSLQVLAGVREQLLKKAAAAEKRRKQPSSQSSRS